jgi:hypothetical protein
MEAQSHSRSTKSLSVAQKQKIGFQKRQISKPGHIARYGNSE